jgi:hypothetical protein
MTDTPLSLDVLTQQISQYQAELERLRRDFETRQTRLTELNQQREALQGQLRQVEAEIEAVTRGLVPAEAEVAPAPPPAIAPKLTDALLQVLGEMDRPMTAKQLGEELVRRHFPTKSKDIKTLVQNRLTELVRKGVLQRAEGQPGVVLAKSRTTAAKGAAAQSNGAAPSSRTGQPSLRSLLIELLKKNAKPIPARELAERVLATGYQTKSNNFTNVVWVALGKIENAEHLKGEGWRLKKKR